MSQTSFVDLAELLAPEKNIGDAPVDIGADALKPHLSPVEIHMLTAAADA